MTSFRLANGNVLDNSAFEKNCSLYAFNGKKIQIKSNLPKTYDFKFYVFVTTSNR